MRVNCAVCPNYLADQHLIAEYREIFMIPGILKKQNYKIKMTIPNKFTLGTGYFTFFKNKLLYLKNRHDEIVKEMVNRGFKTNYRFILENEFPKNLTNDWQPTLDDSILIRNRIIQRLKEKPTFYKYFGKSICNIEDFSYNLFNSKLYFV